MGTVISDFKDLIVWQKAAFGKEVYRLTQNYPKKSVTVCVLNLGIPLCRFRRILQKGTRGRDESLPTFYRLLVDRSLSAKANCSLPSKLAT